MGKKLEEQKKKLDKSREVTVKEALKEIKDNSFVKFDETLEIAINLGVDPKHSDQLVRGVVKLPSGSGKTVRVAVICKDDKIAIAKEAGADLVGSMEIIDDIKGGKIEFDVCIATPDMMGVIGQVARVLGPKGLMPNPKLGTVTMDIASAVKDAKTGKIDYRVDKNGIVHAGLGKLSFEVEDLEKNVNTFIESVIKARPSGAKGAYLKKIHLSSTMGLSRRIDISSVN